MLLSSYELASERRLAWMIAYNLNDYGRLLSKPYSIELGQASSEHQRLWDASRPQPFLFSSKGGCASLTL